MRVPLISSSAALPGPVDCGWSAYGDKAEAEFGYAVDGAGDVNGDGKTDIIIGAPKYKYDEKTVMGRAFVYLNDQTTEYANNKVFIPFTFNSK